MSLLAAVTVVFLVIALSCFGVEHSLGKLA